MSEPPALIQETEQVDVTILRSEDDKSYAVVFYNADVDMTSTLMVRHENDEYRFASGGSWERVSVEERVKDAAFYLNEEIRYINKAARP